MLVVCLNDLTLSGLLHDGNRQHRLSLKSQPALWRLLAEAEQPLARPKAFKPPLARPELLPIAGLQGWWCPADEEHSLKNDRQMGTTWTSRPKNRNRKGPKYVPTGHLGFPY